MQTAEEVQEEQAPPIHGKVEWVKQQYDMKRNLVSARSHVEIEDPGPAHNDVLMKEIRQCEKVKLQGNIQCKKDIMLP